MYVLFKTNYNQDIDFLVRPDERIRVGIVILLALFAPIIFKNYFLIELSMLYVYAIAGVGLMLLTGFTGQVSFGHASFLGIGAYVNAILLTCGLPFLIALPIAGISAGLAGFILGRATSGMHGFYLAIATLAFGILVETIIGSMEITGGYAGLSVPSINISGFTFSEGIPAYYLTLGILLFAVWVASNFMRSPTGRSFVAVRDSETSAGSLGVDIRYYKILSFFISAFITGIAGALMGHLLFYLSPETFGVMESLRLLLMIIVGGLGSISGALFGAAFISFLPNFIDFLKSGMPDTIADQPGLEQLVFGLLIAIVIIFEPKGINGRWQKIKLFIETFPYYKKSSSIRQKQYLKTERFR